MVVMIAGNTAAHSSGEAGQPEEHLPPFASNPGSMDLLNWMEASRQQHGDIFRTTLYGGMDYVICNPEYVEHVLLRKYQIYRKGAAIKRIEMLLGNGLISSEGALWKRQRRMIQPTFHPKNLNLFFDEMNDANMRLKAKWLAAADAGQAVNVTLDISHMTLEIVLKTIFGKDYEAVADTFSLVSEDRVRDLGFAQRFRSLASIVVKLRNSRRVDEDCHDFLGMFMRARDRDTGEPMSDAQLANEILTLIVAGHETTAGTLAWAWYLLSQHPQVFGQLAREAVRQREPLTVEALAGCEYARRVIEETMRLYPAVWLMTRRAIQDDQLGGYFVPRGAEIYIPFYIIQRHPGYWPEPDRFNPDRFEKTPTRGAQIPFGHGPRSCIGENLARLEMLLHLLVMSGSLRMHYDHPAPLDYELGVNLRNKSDFIMHPERL
jgi:cytochrome P450